MNVSANGLGHAGIITVACSFEGIGW